MDGETLFAVIVGGLVIIGVLFVGFNLFASFYDLDSFDGEGELGIDTDSIDDLGDSIEDASDEIFENYDFEAITDQAIFFIIIGLFFAMIIAFLYIATR